jgi:aspartyl protease family protein
MLVWLIVLLAALVGLFYALSGYGNPLTSLEGGEIAAVAVFGALALLYAVSLAGDYRGGALRALRHVGIWFGLFFVLIAAYAFRDDLGHVVRRVGGELLPAGVPLPEAADEQGNRSVRLRKHTSGHFVARGSVNGAPVSMLVDTGASSVVLKPADAERAGIDVSALSFSTPVTTANGVTFAAPVRLRSLAIGDIVVDDVEALVSKPGNLNESLLGMSFLRRLRSYEFSGDFLTLRG